MSHDDAPRPALVERLLARKALHRRRHPLFRIAFVALGALVLAAGVVMLVTPGPAFVLIPVGLSILALEFTWAEKLLERSLRHAEAARRKAAAASGLQRALGIAAGFGAAALALVAAVTWGPL